MRGVRLSLLVLSIVVSTVAASAAVPPGFQDSLVVPVASPTALAFTPDGRLLITSQTGKLRVYANGALVPTAALDLAAILCTNSERGLLGVVADPAFTTNHFIYLYYTLNKNGVCDRNTAASPVNRVSRFTLSNANVVDRASELVLIDNIPSPNGNHNGGDLKFGRDGYLYVSVGDGGCDYNGDSGCAGANDASRDQHVLLGKILRITSTGGIPAGNPFVGGASVRCNTTGRAQPGQQCRETFAWGFRNPFRIAFDPNASGTRFFINDVGQDVWEEIDEGIAGADYGWNVREGHCANNSTTNCGTPPAGMTNPIFDYQHAAGCASITGGAFVPANAWPAAYNGGYLFSDYVCGSIFQLTRQTNGTYTRTTFASGLGASSAVTLLFGPWQGSQALFYTSYANGGEVRVISATTNHDPVAKVTASPLSGPTPLAVTFDASSSSDADGDTLTFAWTFGDGTTATTARTSHTYTTPGRYTATVTVSDTHGAKNSASIVIDAGNAPPTPTITAPAATATFSVGQTITLTGSATDAEDGTIPAARLSWTVTLHHNTHTHPYLPATSGNNVTFQAPAPEDLAATTASYIEISLTATDSRGASTTVTRNVQPKKVTVTIDTVPSGLQVNVNGTQFTTPQNVTSWDRYQLTLSATTQRDASNRPFLFAAWSDGGAATHTVTTPSTATTYVARFDAATASSATADTYVRGGSFAGQTFGTSQTLGVKNSPDAEYQRRAFVRFNVTPASIGRAVLRLHAALSGAGNVGVAAYAVSNTTWSESATTWNTQPTVTGNPLSAVPITSTTPAWYEWDVTSYVRAERAAGRSIINFALLGQASSSPYAVVDARQSSNGPELLVTGTTAPTSDDIVLWASQASAVSGAWERVTDTTAAGGIRLHNPDAKAPKAAAALQNPVTYTEFTFNAEAGRPYHLWIRGKADGNSYSNDSVFVQFSGSVTSSGAAAYRIGTTAATIYVLEECSGCAIKGWGWEDNGYGPAALGPNLYFATTGPQTIRIQTREDGLSFDQIVLSPGTYLTQPPGPPRNDSTIVPRP